MAFKSGYVAILGQPNVGKSTLLNRLIGQPLAIVTPKPQTTRNRIVGILTRPASQMIFVDTPGYHSIPQPLHQYMLNQIEQTLHESDIFCFLVDPRAQDPDRDDELMDRLRVKERIVVVNKADTFQKGEREQMAEALRRRWDLKELFFISALQGDGVEELLAVFEERLPTGPALFPEDTLTELPVRFLAAESIREQAMELLFQEVPYGLAVEILEFEEKPQITVIKANLVVEKDSHKGMVIGKKGEMIKKIGTRAREKVELLLEGRKVFLELNVKVDPNWTRSAERLRAYGYA